MAKHKKGGTGAGGGKRGGGRLSSALAQVQATEARLKRAKHAEKVKEAQSQRHKANRGGQSTAKGKEKARHERCLFENGERILLVGEGNFSFAASVVTHHGIGGHLLTATCYDSETVLHAKYPDVNSHLATLRAAGAEVVFDVDAGALDTDKRTRGRRWDRVAWLFPHIGAGIKDEARNVSANQVEIMLFLRAVQSVLQEGAEQRWNVRQVSPDEDEDVELGDPNTAAASTGRPGRVSIVLRNAPPYTLWDVPSLAKRGPTLAPTILYPSHPTLRTSPQPRYTLVRSARFDPAAYPGYSHRRTVGWKEGLSTTGCEDIRMPARERGKGAGGGEAVGDARIWEFELVRPEPSV